MSAVCPACGVAVVPGYVKCPRCHAALPLGGGRGRRTAGDPGGTAVARRGFPVSAVLIGAGVTAAVILVFGLRGGSKPIAAESTALPPPIAAQAAQAPRVAAAPLTVTAREPARADTGEADRRTAAIAALEAILRRERLWGRAEILGARIDLRSGACADPAMGPVVDGALAVLHGAGLTRLRCLEQSGAVVFERDL